MSKYNKHSYDKLLKRCPFCASKAILRSPIKLKTSRSYICSDISCKKNCVTIASWCWDKKGNDLSRLEQDQQVIKTWNTRK